MNRRLVTKAERRERKRRPSMKVSGGHVKKIQQLIAKRARKER